MTISSILYKYEMNNKKFANTFYAACLYNALYVVMVMVGPDLAYNYDYTALQVHYKFVHSAL